MLMTLAAPAGPASATDSEGILKKTNTYGAIAYSPYSRSIGSVTAKSKEDAERFALQDCQDRSDPPDCELAMSWKNAYGAIALTSEPNGPGGWATGPTDSVARDRAIANCKRFGGGDDCRKLRVENALPS